MKTRRNWEKRIARFLVMVMVFTSVPMQNHQKANAVEKENVLPFSLEETDEGVNDGEVIAKKLTLTNDNASIVDTGLTDLVVVKEIDHSVQANVYLVSSKGVLHTFIVDADDPWLDKLEARDGKKQEVFQKVKARGRRRKNGAFDAFDSYQSYGGGCYYDNVLFRVLNPKGKYDLLNLSSGEYFLYNCDGFNNDGNIRSCEEFITYRQDDKYGFLNVKGEKLCEAEFSNNFSSLSENVIWAPYYDEDKGCTLISTDGVLKGIDSYAGMYGYNSEWRSPYDYSDPFAKERNREENSGVVVKDFDDNYIYIDIKNKKKTPLNGENIRVVGRMPNNVIAYKNEWVYDEFNNVGEKAYLISGQQHIDLNDKLGGDYCEIEELQSGNGEYMQVQSFSFVRDIKGYWIREYVYRGIIDSNGNKVYSSDLLDDEDKIVDFKGDYVVAGHNMWMEGLGLGTYQYKLIKKGVEEPVYKSDLISGGAKIYGVSDNYVALYAGGAIIVDVQNGEIVSDVSSWRCYDSSLSVNEEQYIVFETDSSDLVVKNLVTGNESDRIEAGSRFRTMVKESGDNKNGKRALFWIEGKETDTILNEKLEAVEHGKGEIIYISEDMNIITSKGIYNYEGKCILNVSIQRNTEHDVERDEKGEGLLLVDYTGEEYNERCTFCDIRGNLLNDYKYTIVSHFRKGIACVASEDADHYLENRFAIVNRDGDELVTFYEDDLSDSVCNKKGLSHLCADLEVNGEEFVIYNMDSDYDSKKKEAYIYDLTDVNSEIETKDPDAAYKKDAQQTANRLLSHAESIPDFKFKGMDVTFTVPEEVPVLGGGEMSLDFGKVPVVFEKSENQFRLGLGIENKKSGDDVEPLLFHDPDTWGSFKKAVEKQKSNLLNGKNILLASKLGVASTPLDKSVETKIYGYIEGTLDDGKIVSEEGKMVMEISFSAEKKWQTMIVVVPVVFTAKAEAGGKFTMELGLDYSESSVICKGEFEFTLPKIRLSAGVGVAYVADISAYGSFTNTLKLSDGWDEEPSITDTVSGELGASASLFCFTYEKALWEGEKEIYPGSKKKLRTYKGVLTEGMKESDFVIDRDYAEKTSEWMNQAEDSGQANQIQVLQKSVYTQANPKIVTLDDGTKLMIFVMDLKERGVGNHTAVAYSVYDTSEGMWSEPEVVDDDGSADFYPEIATDGVHTFITWANAGKIDFTKDTTINEMAKACDISVARFDLASRKFVDITSLTDNNYADLRPSIAVKDDMACVTWLANENSDCLELSGNNEICYALNENGVWGEAKSYLITQKPIKDVKVGELDTEVKIAYTIDEDADFATTEDVKLCIGNLTNEDAIVVDARKNLNSLQFAKLDGKNILAFSDDTGLCYMENVEKCHKLLDEKVQTGANYQFVSGNNSDMVICSEPTEQGSNIKGYIVKDGIVGHSIPLTNQKNYIKNPNGFYENGKYYLAFTREQVGIAEGSLDISADICVMQFGEYTDVAVNAIDVDEDTIVPGAEGNISVNISNLGTEYISECNIQIKNGEEIVGTTKVKELEPGMEMAKVVSIQLPVNYTEGTKLTCEAIVEGEKYLENNSLEFEAGKTNLELDVFTPETVTYVNAYVTNTSGFGTTGVLNVYDTDEKGEILKRIELGEIKAGERKRIKLSSLDLEEITKSAGSLCFKVVSAGEETYYSDNYGFVFVAKQNQTGDNDEKGEVGDGEETGSELSPSITPPPQETGSDSLAPAVTNKPSVKNKGIPSSRISSVIKVKTPGKVNLKKVKALGRRKVKASWKWSSTVDGYQLQYAMNRSFSKKRKTKNKSCMADTATIKKLKKGKTYYFRVRAYRKTYYGTKKYGKWSNVKKIRVK